MEWWSEGEGGKVEVAKGGRGALRARVTCAEFWIDLISPEKSRLVITSFDTRSIVCIFSKIT